MEAFAVVILPIFCAVALVVFLFWLTRRGGLFANDEQSKSLDRVDKDLEKKGM